MGVFAGGLKVQGLKLLKHLKPFGASKGPCSAQWYSWLAQVPSPRATTAANARKASSSPHRSKDLRILFGSSIKKKNNWTTLFEDTQIHQLVAFTLGFLGLSLLSLLI